MRRDRYILQFAAHLSYLHRLATKYGLDYDETNDVISKVSEHVLLSKKYRSVKTSKLKAFLRTALRFEMQHARENMARRSMVIARFSDESQSTFDSKVVVTDVVNEDVLPAENCPFCFKADLNQYGACGLCGTILPSSRCIRRTVFVVSEETLAIEFAFNTCLDVQKALARLTPFEQKVVTAIGLGNETLDSFCEVQSKQRSLLWRTWLGAKAKLQSYLQEYSPDYLPKHGPAAFCDAIQKSIVPVQNVVD